MGLNREFARCGIADGHMSSAKHGPVLDERQRSERDYHEEFSKYN